MAILRLRSKLTRYAEALRQDAKVLRAIKEGAAVKATLLIEMWLDECMASMAVIEREVFLRQQEQGVDEAVIEEATAEVLRELFGDETLDLLVKRIQDILHVKYGHGFNDMEVVIYAPPAPGVSWIGLHAVLA